MSLDVALWSSQYITLKFLPATTSLGLRSVETQSKLGHHYYKPDSEHTGAQTSGAATPTSAPCKPPTLLGIYKELPPHWPVLSTDTERSRQSPCQPALRSQTDLLDISCLHLFAPVHSQRVDWLIVTPYKRSSGYHEPSHHLCWWLAEVERCPCSSVLDQGQVLSGYKSVRH